MSKKDATPAPDDIVMARRRAGYGSVTLYRSYDASAPGGGLLVDEGDLVPMRYQEACDRSDFEPTDAPVPKES